MKLLLTLLTVALMTASTFAAAGDKPFTNLRPQINADGSYERPQDITAKMARALADLYGLASTNGFIVNVQGTNISVEITNSTFTASVTNDVNLNPTNTIIVSNDVNLNPTNTIIVSNDVNLNPTNAVIVSSITADVNLSPTNTIAAGTVSAVPDASGTNLFLFKSSVGGANNTAPAAVSLLVFNGLDALDKWVGNVSATNNVNLNGTNTIGIQGNLNLDPTNAISVTVTGGQGTNVSATLAGGPGTNVSATMSAASLAYVTEWTNNIIVKASPGTLLSLKGFNSGPSQYIQLFDAAAVPGTNATPICVITVLETNNFSLDWTSYGLPCATGIVAACSTTANVFTVGDTNIWFTATYK